MVILAIDSASRSCSVAVLDDHAVLAEINDVSGQTHSRHLMAMVDRVVAMSIGELARVDGYAVTRGPGSFTGLRIGISAAKGLAEAGDRPLVGVSSLEALAWQVYPAEALVVPMLDARRKEVYTARFIFNDRDLQRQRPERALPPEEALEGVEGACVLVGDGAVTYGDRLRARLGPQMRMALPFQNIIRASTVAFLARQRLADRQDERASLAPHYIRKSYVEEGRPNTR
ncbi:MAG: tRNA (adenosine(37)-N6)-threonylcarbamoyltransferase complex dimerization subunit type 1 TsaB [Desulfobacterales bacterium]|jgi:tRNA threonylcarbamoyladenosine biosynthesis protein TsaB